MNTQPTNSAAKLNLKSAIGVIDSGVGGLSVLREIHQLLPDIPTLYFADQGHLPYGSRPADQIREYVQRIADFLIAQGAVIVVLACHAASAAALEHLRACYPDTPIVGIEPAVKPAAESTRSGVIGVLTTQATADGALYRRVVARYAANVRVITQVAPELVTVVEQGTQDTPEGDAVLRGYVLPLLDAGADQIVLACTHFPFLRANLENLTNVALVDPGAAVARQVARVLATQVSVVDAWQSSHRYFTSSSPAAFQAMLARLIGVTADVSHQPA
ncbi:MAG: glutamate racemase [Chloroflexota bacterium]